MVSEEIDVETFAGWLSKLSGQNRFGESNCGISYQCYAAEDDNDDRETVYTVSRGYCRFSMDKMNPGFVTLDIVFKSYSDPELRLLWGRLERFKKNISEFPEKTWIFYMNVVDAEGVRLNDEDIMTVHIVNPLIWYLTRENPDQLSDEVSVEEELQGGNILRMLLNTEGIALRYENLDIPAIEAEVMRYNDLDNVKKPEWDEE